MLQYYYISLVNINYVSSSNSSINSKIVQGLTFNVVQNLGDTLVPIGFLMDANFEIFINNIDSKIGTDWQLVQQNTNGDYEITFNSPKEFQKGDYLIVIVNRPQIISNKLFVDFQAETNNSGEYTTENYKITTPGTYYFVIDSVDGVKVNKRSQYAYTFVAE